MNTVVRCNYCHSPEFYGELRWLDGREMCRDCYRHEYEETEGKPYEWDDLDGERPPKGKWDEHLDWIEEEEE